MAFLDRTRAQRLMAEAGLDALILLSPESFRYASGAAPGVATMWRRSGAVAVLVPADAGAPEAAVVSDLFAANFRRDSHIADIRESPLWVEAGTLPAEAPSGDPARALADLWAAEGRGPDFARPTTFDPAVCHRHLADALAERGLARGRIGVELSAVSAAEWPALQAALAPAALVEADGLIARLKMVKSPGEIALLRQAVELAEIGIAAVRDAAAPGVSRADLATVWADTVVARRGAAPLTGQWEYISVGADPWGGNAVAATGDLIKVDVGCLMGGYTSDTGRTFVLGPPSDAQRRLFDALMAGFRAGLATLAPGVPLAEVHRAATAAIHAAGFAGYSRGHFGHGLGAGLGSEEWPFIAADCPVAAEPGMVLAFECPWYLTGVGGLIVENQLLVTETGIETMNRLPEELIALPLR